MTTTANETFSMVNEVVFNNLTTEQLIEEVAYADEALETLSLERDIVGDCEEISELETRFRNYRRKFVELLGFDPSDLTCSMAITGESPFIDSTFGLSIWLSRRRASAERLSIYLR